MATPRVYITGGTISVANGDAFFTGADTQFGVSDLEGATLWVYGASGSREMVGHVAAIDPRYPEGVYEHLGPVPLVHAWTGTTIVDEADYVLELSPAIISSATVSAILSRFVAHLENNAGLTYNAADSLNYALVENNSVIIDSVSRTMSQLRNGVLDPVYTVGLTENPAGPWVGDPQTKTALSISSGDVAVDHDAGAVDSVGRRHFALSFDDDFELQLPTNVEVDEVIDILFTASGGGHTPSFEAGYSGTAASAIDTTDGARTRLRFTVSAETAGTATAVTVSNVVFAQNDLVEDHAFNFVSNVDGNIAEPQVDGGNPISDANWTWKPGISGIGDKYTVAFSATGRPQDGEFLLRHEFEATVTFPASMTGSRAGADVAATGSAVFSITKNGVEVGTVTYSISDAGVFVLALETVFTAGDVLRVIAPSPRDATLSHLSMTFAGNR